MTDTNEKICFVIAPIGKPESDIRNRSDQVLKHIIRPAVEACGYKAVRADEIAEPGIITNQIIRHVVDDPLVIADLTGQNANVFYELAIRHACRRPLVQIIDKVKDIPFDLSVMRTIQVDHQNLDSVEEAKTEIRRQIQSLAASPSSLENPISVALADRSGSNPLDEIRTQAQDYLEEIERNRDKSYEIIQDMNAESADDDPTKAKQVVEDIRENPQASSTDKAIAEAVSLQEQGDVEEAIKIWRGIADAFEEVDRDLTAGAHFSVGYLLFQQGKHEDSITAYDEAIRLKPTDAGAYSNRGNTKHALRRYSDAIADYDEAIRLEADHAVAYNNRGNAKHALGRHADAIADYDEAIRLEADYAIAYSNRGNAKAALGRREEAIADYDEAIRLEADYAIAHNNRGNAKAALGRREEAIADYDEAIRLEADYAEAYSNRGEAKAALGRHNAAIADYDEAIRRKPDLAETYRYRGETKAVLGLNDEARQDFEKIRDLARKTDDASLVALAEQRLRKLDSQEGE